jgi:hypothetical protein
MITEIHSKRVCYVFILTSKLVKWTRNLCESALKSRSWRWKVNSLSYKKSENSPKNKQNNQHILDVSNTSQTGEERGVSRASHSEVSSANETRHRRDCWHVVEKLEWRSWWRWWWCWSAKSWKEVKEQHNDEVVLRCCWRRKGCIWREEAQLK